MPGWWSSPFSHEEDDVDPSAWVTDSNLTCRLCEHRTRMPGHPICSYCDRVGVPANALAEVIDLERLLKRHAAFDAWCAENHRTESEAMNA